MEHERKTIYILDITTVLFVTVFFIVFYITIKVENLNIMTNAQMVYSLLESIIFLVPVGTLIWKAAKQSATLSEHEKRITTIETDIKETQKQTNEDIKEIKEQITDVRVTIGRLCALLEGKK